MFAQVYKAEHPKLALKVYCLKYEASLETDRYISALQQEQAAFENLIASKGHMVGAVLGDTNHGADETQMTIERLGSCCQGSRAAQPVMPCRASRTLPSCQAQPYR